MSGAGETWKTLKRPRFLVLNLSGIVYRNTSKITTQCYSQGINQQKCVGKFWYLKYFSCGVHLRNTSRLFLATQTLDTDIWTTNQNIRSLTHFCSLILCEWLCAFILHVLRYPIPDKFTRANLGRFNSYLLLPLTKKTNSLNYAFIVNSIY